MAASPAGSPTLRSLLARPDLRLRLASDLSTLDAGALDSPLRWVHSSDLPDPTPFLSDGLLLLTTGTQFAEEADDSPAFAEYVRRLARRGVAGLGFGTEVVRAGIPEALAAACREQRMPLFEVPYLTPFIAVARANAEAIAAESYSRRSWALSAQRAISLAALRPDGLGATLAELARQLDAWVGLFDAAGTLVREHPASGLDADTRGALQREAESVLRRGARAASSFRAGATPFTMQTLGRGGYLRGVIAIASGELDQEGRGVVTAVVAMAGLALEQRQGLDQARALLRAGLVQSLRSGEPTLVRRIARDLWGGLPAAPIVIAATDAATARRDAVHEWLELRADERAGTLFFGRGDDGIVLVTGADDTAIIPEFAERFGARVGASDPTDYDGFDRGLDRARRARDRPGSGVSWFADLAQGGVLASLRDHDSRTIAAAVLEPLTRNDDETGTELLETLRVWLECDCSNEASARALGVHRHTVRARIALASRLLERDLASFAVRADLWAALSLAR